MREAGASQRRQSTALERTASDPSFRRWKQDEETVHTLKPSASIFDTFIIYHLADNNINEI